MSALRVGALILVSIIVMVLTLPYWGMALLYLGSWSWSYKRHTAEREAVKEQARSLVLLHPLVQNMVPKAGFTMDTASSGQELGSKVDEVRFHIRAVNTAERSVYVFVDVSHREAKPKLRLACIVPLPIIDAADTDAIATFNSTYYTSNHPDALDPETTPVTSVEIFQIDTQTNDP
jgi:hypothetical protein